MAILLSYALTVMPSSRSPLTMSPVDKFALTTPFVPFASDCSSWVYIRHRSVPRDEPAGIKTSLHVQTSERKRNFSLSLCQKQGKNSTHNHVSVQRRYPQT